MELQAIGIPIAFVLLATILLWLLIGAKGHWSLKMVFVAVTLYFSIAMWSSTGDLVGWASSKELPKKFLVHWMIVKEGMKDKKDSAIFIWATELNKEFKPKEEDVNPYFISFVAKKLAAEPRSYRIDYSREMHEQAMNILRKIRQGKRIVGENTGGGFGIAKKGGEGKGKGKGGEKGKKGKGGGEFNFSRKQKFMFYELPRAKLPPKVQ